MARQKRFDVTCSPFILNETKKNLVVKFNYSDIMADKFIEEILKFVLVVTPKVKVDLIKEKVDDNRILDCALVAKADYLISGDKKHILPLKKFRGTYIISVREFIEKFDN